MTDWFKKYKGVFAGVDVQQQIQQLSAEHKTDCILVNSRIGAEEMYVIEVWLNLKSGCKVINIYQNFKNNEEDVDGRDGN